VDHLLDTSVAIQLRDSDSQVAAEVGKLGGALLLSIITRIELENGIHRDAINVAARRPRLDAILPTFQTLPFDEAAIDAYRLIVERLGYSRRKMLNRMIAAQALVQRATLVTLNGADFRDVPGLQLLEW
jgi:predicted nucleic acid-binding protein